jgi:nucleoside-diphosphate-sugar epimerase
LRTNISKLKEEPATKILVLGGTGTVSSHSAHELLARDWIDVRILTRTAEDAEGLPKGTEGMVGDLLEPATEGRSIQASAYFFSQKGLSPFTGLPLRGLLGNSRSMKG